MRGPPTVHAVLPAGVDDVRRPSGGNRYDRRVLDVLTTLRWPVREHQVPGRWPDPDAAALTGLADVLDRRPDGALVLMDGLLASAAAGLVAAAAARLRVVVLVHLPLGACAAGRRPAERALLSAVSAVVATSDWTRRWLLETYRVDPGRVHMAPPGVDPAPLAHGTREGGRLLSVGAVTPVKGYDVLLAALAGLPGPAWRWECVGSLEVEPHFARRLQREVHELGLAGRVGFTGVLDPARLAGAYASADLLVLASRAESFGMVVTEALAHGIPVVAPQVGGIPEALGHGAGGDPPGVLVPAGDPAALRAALVAWLADPGERDRLRELAGARRRTLTGWRRTGELVARALGGCGAGPNM